MGILGIALLILIIYGIVYLSQKISLNKENHVNKQKGVDEKKGDDKNED